MTPWTSLTQWLTRLRGGVVLVTALVLCLSTLVIGLVAITFTQTGADHTTSIVGLGSLWIALTCGSAFVIDRVLYRFLAPMRNVLRAMRRVTEHDGVRVEETGFRDLRTLARSFNRMAEHLDQRHGADAEHTSELERSAARRAQQLEVANEQLRTLDRAKDALLSNVSHEMRTPLTSIIAASEIIRSFTDESPESRYEFLDIIDRESKRLLAIIESILELAQIEAKEIELEREEVDLREVVEEAVCAHVEAAREQGVALHAAPPSRAIRIQGDRTRLIELTSRLLDNAVKFSKSGQRVDVDLSVEAGEAVMRVVDEGPGVPPERRATLFGSFRQNDDALTDKPQGVGVGLAICSGIAEAHGGSLKYEERSWRGSRFVLRIPLSIGALREAGSGKHSAASI